MQLKFTDGKLSFCKNNIPVCISYEEIAFLQSRGFATLITCISGKTYTVGIPFHSFAKILSNPEGFFTYSQKHSGFHEQYSLFYHQKLLCAG